MSIDYNILVDDLNKEEPLSEQEMALRSLFVHEYLKDYNPIAAARRCGFVELIAKEYAIAYMQEPYVQRLLSTTQLSPSSNPEEELSFDKRRIRAGLMHEAHYYGPGSSHAARVNAFSTLAKLYHVEDEYKPKVEKKGGMIHGGVMEVPGLIGLEAWETQSKKSQTQLQEDVRK
jgi:hypothetical protein